MASINAFNGTLGEEKAAHLLRRATFGPTKKQVQQFSGLTAAQGMDLLFVEKPAPTPIFPPTGQPLTEKPAKGITQFDLIDAFRGWWLDRMRTGGTSIQERMVYFLHTHFTSKKGTVGSGTAIYYQNALMRRYAFGNFKELSKKICLDNAMIIFLDSRLNQVGRPNENFGREFLELYTIGKGPQIGPDDYTNYTEQDVKAAAEVLSGYINDYEFAETDPETGLGIAKLLGDGNIATQHDATVKQFSEKFGNATVQPKEVIGKSATKESALDELDQLVTLIFNQEETARHICRKLYRFFTYYRITEEIENDIISPMAQTFINNDFSLEAVVRQLLMSQHFYDEDNAVNTDDVNGALIKSPLEITLGICRFFEIKFPNINTNPQESFDIYKGRFNEEGKANLDGILLRLKDQGIDLYEPFEVAGYPAYHQAPGYNRNWISANYLAFRYEFIQRLLKKPDGEGSSLGIYLNTAEFVKKNVPSPENAKALVQFFVKNLLPEIITEARFDFFKNDVFLQSIDGADIPGLESGWASTWTGYVSGSNGEEDVRPALDRLIQEIIQSPEFQLF